MNPSSGARDLLREAISRRALFADTGDGGRFISPSGRRQSWMIDTRRVLFESALLEAIGEAFWEQFEPHLPFQVGGMEMAAVPIVSTILLAAAKRGHRINGFIVRKERKPHGRMQAIENDLNELPIVIVDDIFNSGASLEKVRAVLASSGRSIWRAWCLIDFSAQAGCEWKCRHGVTVSALFDLAEFKLVDAAKTRAPVAVELIPRWHRAFGAANPFYRVPKSAPRFKDGRILIGSESGALLCIEGTSGDILWSFQTGALRDKGIWSSPCVAGNVAIFGSYDGNLYAVDIETGREVWRNIEADWIGSSPCHAPDLGLVFVGLEHAAPHRAGAIGAFDVASGEQRWTLQTAAFVHGSPAYDAMTRTVVCGTNDGVLLALEAEHGVIHWQAGVNAAIKHAPAIDPTTGSVIVGAFDGTIRCFDLRTGAPRFTVQTGNTVYTTPLIDNGRVYCGSTDKQFYVIDLASGATIATLPVAAKIFCSPKRIGAWIWFGATDGRLRAIDPENLEIVGDTQLPEAITTEVGYDARYERIVVATNAGTLQSFSIVDCEPRPPTAAVSSGKRTRVKALELARLTVDAFRGALALPDPASFDLTDENENGGAFTSLRDRLTGERVARAGLWVRDSATCPSANCIVLATARACASVPRDVLKHVDIGLTMIGPLVSTTLGALNTKAFGVVVVGASGRPIGGALPNSPEFSNESGQYLHALRNARLTVDARHDIYRHTVAKYTESPDWPPFGAPDTVSGSAELDAFIAWVLGTGDASLAEILIARGQLRAVAVTHYLDGRTATAMHDASAPERLRSNLLTTIDGMRQAGRSSPRARAALVLSVLLRGKRMDGNRRLDDSTMRVMSDAVIRYDGAQRSFLLPTMAMQRNMRAADIDARLRKTPDQQVSERTPAVWELCPCRSWLIDPAGPIALEGAFTRHGHDGQAVQLDSLLGDTFGYACARLMTAEAAHAVYLPVIDQHLRAHDDREQWIASLAAISAAAAVMGKISVREDCTRRIDAYLDALHHEPSRWQHERRAALRALLACSSDCFAAKTTLIDSTAKSCIDALAVQVMLRAARAAGRRDLREWQTPVAAALDGIRRHRIADAQLWGEAACALIAAGSDELRLTLVKAAHHIVATQLSDSGAFVPAMNAYGPTAATATLTHVLSLALSIVDSEAPAHRTFKEAWRRSLPVLDGLRIREIDRFCLKSPARAIGAIRDAQGASTVSAMSCAILLCACAHARSIGLGAPLPLRGVTPPGISMPASTAVAADLNQ
jgi:outer membrane protein assembly factor BamB